MPDSVTPRGRLHHAIRREFTSALSRHLREHPEQINDPEMEMQIKSLLLLLERILAAVDTFGITELDAA